MENKEPITSNLDGAMQMYDVLDPSNLIPSNYNDEDDFYPAVGKLGKVLKKAAANRKANKAKRQVRKDIKVKSKATARVNRTQAKVTQAQAQKTAAKGLADNSADVAMAKSLGKMGAAPSGAAAKGGLSTMAWVGIGVGVLALGVGAYFVFKKK